MYSYVLLLYIYLYIIIYIYIYIYINMCGCVQHDVRTFYKFVNWFYNYIFILSFGVSTPLSCPTKKVVAQTPDTSTHP